MGVLEALAALSAIALATIWIGYPLAIAGIAALAARVPRRCAGTRPEPTVTVVIATREDDAAVRARVNDLLRTDYDPERVDVVVAVDFAAGPPTPRDLRYVDGRVRVVTGDPPGGKAATLNAGVRAARGQIIVFADTHQRFDASSLPALVSALGDARLGAVSGSLELPETVRRSSLLGWYWTYERWLRRNEARLHSTVGVTGAIYAMRRELWVPLPAGLILDDLYAPMRVVLGGRRVGFAEAARARETRHTAPAQEYKRKVRTLTGVIQLCAWLPAALVPLRNPIWIQFVFHKLLRLLTPYLVLGVAMWASVAAVRGLAARPAIGIAAVVTAAVGAYLWRRNVMRVVREAMLIQGAVLVATLNGVRGRWDVWR